MANHNRKITRSMFETIHILHDSKMPRDEIAKYLKISPSSVTRATNTSTYEEFEQDNAVRAINQRKAYARKKAAEQNIAKETTEKKKTEPEQPEPAIENRQTIVVQASHYMLEEQKKTNELLTSISNKLAFIVEELTGKTEVHRDE